MRMRIVIAGRHRDGDGIASRGSRRWWRPGASTRTRRRGARRRRASSRSRRERDPRRSRSTRRPSAVWPWLVQMGFGRGRLVQLRPARQRGKSADGIVAAWQAHDGRRHHADLPAAASRSRVGRARSGAGPALATRPSSTARRPPPTPGDVKATDGRRRAGRASPRRARSLGRPRRSSRRAGRSSSSRSRWPDAAHRAVPRLVRRSRSGVPRRHARSSASASS